MLEVSYEEGKILVQKNVCAACGAPLTLAWGGAFGINGHVVRCGKDPQHQGLIEQATMTQALRRGTSIPIYAENKIEAKSLKAMDQQRAVDLVQQRFPAANLDRVAAAFFLWDCLRQNLDPFLGEAVPIPFKAKDGRRLTVTVITVDGALSLAARACPDLFMGPPQTKPVTDPVLKESICGDPDAFVWEARGRRRDGEEYSTWGWVKTKEHTRAAQRPEDRQTPMSELPGNQARIRAIKRWVREVFPEARHLMLQQYTEARQTLQEAAEAEEADVIGRILDVEFQVVPTIPEEPPQASPSTPSQSTVAGPLVPRTTSAEDVFDGPSGAQLDFLRGLAERKLGLNRKEMVERLGTMGILYAEITKAQVSKVIEEWKKLPDLPQPARGTQQTRLPEERRGPPSGGTHG